ncbi:MAG: IS91 family transposase [Candidatus Zhuqueibacterota bacterium]
MSSCRAHSSKTVGNRPKYELADILRKYLPLYKTKHRLSRWQKKILYDIQVCRTADCGAHLEVCDVCHYQQPAYNSCHNRHCPKCQGIVRRQWVAARLKELLPVPYYHVVFTLPHRLNTLALYNKRLIYNLFYHAAAYALLKFGKDPKFLGGQLGFIGVLHTWGKGLCYHIHWHFIIPGGGITQDGDWKALPYHDKFLFPGTAMGKVIKARFIKLLRKAYLKGKITFPTGNESLQNVVMFEYFLNDIASDNWVSYAKSPFGGPKQVVKYVGCYTHKVALSNNRLIDISGGNIHFYVKNYKKGGSKESCNLSAEEFIRRFLLHILPKRFRKIRYGGFLAQAIREEKIEQIRQSLGIKRENEHRDSADREVSKLKDDLFIKCPKCQIGHMRSVEDFKPIKQHIWSVYNNTP